MSGSPNPRAAYTLFQWAIWNFVNSSTPVLYHAIASDEQQEEEHSKILQDNLRETKVKEQRLFSSKSE